MKSLVALVCLTVALACQGYAQHPSDAFVKWSSSRVIPLRTVDAGGDVNDLLPVEKLIGPARVVALGEPTHGAHEPLAFRNRLIQFLVEHMGFTAVALETGFTESETVERYIEGGHGDLDTVARNGMTWSFGGFPENHELIQWMRDYNADAAHHRKIHFYGIDLSGANNGVFSKARVCLDASIDYLARVNSAAADRIRERMDGYLDRFADGKYASLSSTEQAELLKEFDALSAALEQDKRSLVAKSTEGEYEWALHNVVVARQLDSMLKVTPPPGPGIPPDAYRAVTSRNSAMADNVQWVLQREGPKGRVLVFAHNMHIMNAPLKGSVWNVFLEPPKSMGEFLRPALGSALVIIGGAGANSSDVEKDPKSLDAVFAAIGVPRFILDLRPARSDPPIWNWLSEEKSLRANFDSHVTIAPAAAFDAIFFVNGFTSAHASGP